MAEEGRRGEEEDRGPGAAHRGFVLMEELVEKLKLLNYEEEVLVKHNMKSLSRHYFVSSPYLASNPGEQFYMFTIIAAWLINVAGRPFTEPQEYDEPNATVSNILAELRALGVQVDFPPSRLKSGSGEHVCLVLDHLAEEALKRRGFTFTRPKYPAEKPEEDGVMDDDAELTLSRVEEEMIEEADDEEEEEENMMDLEALKLPSSHAQSEPSSKPDRILESTVDAAEWRLEVERVLPQLRVTIRTDNKDWRIHLDQMHQHRDGITSSLRDTRSYLDKLQEDMGKTLEKVGSREKYINKQLEQLIQEYRSAQAKLSQAKERYKQASGGVTERSRVLAEISEELEKVKQEMEDKGSSMCDGAPLVKIKQSLTKLKQEMVQMDVRIGVVQHTLLQAKLKEKSNMTRDMHATNIPEPAAGPLA
ncbi:intraflagellar transport protein 57 homolog isoform X1 [Fundulus heteroclitus]|uniref:intraflagellar transport protein 57 homolog isoform X1 n=2 Tax=Fundulus heteroclitus TaxID=8078 RepID=UPI00165CE9EC|nr:intraflagellar transport protein 57 homolog isoform X1 [Fundulus heteroclitus]